jgi:hypothetical protein
LGKDNQAYFLQRAAEEQAAAEGASCAAAADAHRELSLRYSLKLILPELAADDSRAIGMPRRLARPAPRPAGRVPAKRRRA